MSRDMYPMKWEWFLQRIPFRVRKKHIFYEYDAWGNVLSIKDGSGNAITDPNHVGNLNPIRYRGYYHDKETNLYYLMSRYYDPVTRRFINADRLISTGEVFLAKNMFLCCENNLIMYIDPYINYYDKGDLDEKRIEIQGCC